MTSHMSSSLIVMMLVMVLVYGKEQKNLADKSKIKIVKCIEHIVDTILLNSQCIKLLI